jgi:hypothetical protein
LFHLIGVGRIDVFYGTEKHKEISHRSVGNEMLREAYRINDIKFNTHVGIICISTM